MDKKELDEIRSTLGHWRRELPPILYREAQRDGEPLDDMISLEECQYRYGALLDIAQRLLSVVDGR